MIREHGALVALLATGVLTAQQLQWQVPASGPSVSEYKRMMPFSDYDQDGYRDFLRLVRTDPLASWPYLQIASGADGGTLWEFTGHAAASPPGACLAGDVDGDGSPDVAILRNFGFNLRAIDVRSPSRDVLLYRVTGSWPGLFGAAMLGDLDVDGDRRPDLVTITSHPSESDVYVYDHEGSLRYTLPCLAKNRIAISLAKLGDLDSDGCDDFVVGCNDASDRGLQWVISGRTGDPIRETFGLLPGDRTSEHVSNLGDIDGDGINDYAAFPYWSASRAIAVAWSGATGTVIRSWNDYANSVVTGEDFDQDGVNDIVTGADWPVIPPNHYGSSRCTSGRDGSELWRVDVVPFPPGQGSNGTTGWMESSASLGVQPGSPYPVLAWLDINAFLSGNYYGRTRAYDGTRAGQGPVTGTPCTSSGTLPRIGVRKLGAGTANTGCRITVALTHPNALAALQLAFSALPTPVDLSPLGFTNCVIYVDPAAVWLRVTGTTGIDRGYAAVDLPHPLTAAATGIDAVAQWLVYAPTTLDHAATQLHALRMQ